LGGQKYFAKLDNLWGYHQLRLDANSSKVTAIITPWGVYRFLSCPFGISTAPGEYQARMAHQVLQKFYLNGSIVYIDDKVVYGAMVGSFLSVLELVLAEMVAFNVRLKPSKCYFGMESIEFLGHIFDQNGVRLSDARVQGIRDLPEPTSVKAVRSFIGMVNYFRDFIPGLSSHLIPLFELTKKKWAQTAFQLTETPRFAFNNIKNLLLNSATLVIMNEEDPLILYTDASTKAVGGVLMQVQGGIEKPCIFVSHVLSTQATRWGIMELELYALVYCVKQLTPYLLGRRFMVKTDHKNLLYLSNSTIPKLVRWRVLLSEFDFVISHISGESNVVADGLTRVFRLQFHELNALKRSVHIDDTIPRLFRLEGEGLRFEDQGYMDSDTDDDNEDVEALGPTERHAIFAKFHNSMVGHFGVEHTLKAMSLEGHEWRGMRRDVKDWISECGICQKIKPQRDPH
jgi:cleavage and polyadenylation specificity factor subunit 1